MISRAKALLIIIGNPFTLSEDKNWKTVVEYCRRNRAFVWKDSKNIIGSSVEETGTHTQPSDQKVNNTNDNGNSEVLTHETPSFFALLKQACNVWITRMKTLLINYIQQN